MNKLLATLIAGLIATSVFAQGAAPAASTPPVAKTAAVEVKEAKTVTKTDAKMHAKITKAKSHHKTAKAKAETKVDAKAPVAK